jgi:hypothetical protein
MDQEVSDKERLLLDASKYILDALISEFRPVLLSVVLSGSSLNSDLFDSESDIDIQVVVKSDIFQNRVVWQKNWLFDIWIRPEKRLAAAFKNPRTSPGTVDMFANGVSVYGGDLTKALIEAARMILSKGFPRNRHHEFLMGRRIAKLSRRVASGAVSEDVARYYCTLIVRDTVELQFLCGGEALPPARSRLAALRSTNIRLHSVVDKLLEVSADPGPRSDALTLLVDEIEKLIPMNEDAIWNISDQ